MTRRLKRRDNYRLCENGSLGGHRASTQTASVASASRLPARCLLRSGELPPARQPRAKPMPDATCLWHRPGQGAGPTKGPTGFSADRPRKGGEGAQSSP